MRTHRLLSALAVALLGSTVLAGDVKSGPQVDEKLAGPFHPLNINGEKAGQKHCLYCENGDRPVAMIFAREVTPETAKLIKAIDAATTKNKGEMGSFVVFLGKNEELESKLKKLVKENNIKTTVLAIDNPAGPEGYSVSKEADVTVVLYRERTVKANHAFKKGELKDSNIKAVITDLPKILK
jgi:hypothetical protein